MTSTNRGRVLARSVASRSLGPLIAVLLLLGVPALANPSAAIGRAAGSARVNASASSISEFPIPTQGSNPAGIAAGADGNLWFTEVVGNKIGRIATDGTIAEFAIPTPLSEPTSIT